MTHDAVITLVRDETGERCVVERADDVIRIADELMDQARVRAVGLFPGDITIDKLDQAQLHDLLEPIDDIP